MTSPMGYEGMQNGQQIIWVAGQPLAGRSIYTELPNDRVRRPLRVGQHVQIVDFRTIADRPRIYEDERWSRRGTLGRVIDLIPPDVFLNLHAHQFNADCQNAFFSAWFALVDHDHDLGIWSWRADWLVGQASAGLKGLVQRYQSTS